MLKFINQKKNEYTTMVFEEWNILHYCIVFCPIPIVAIAVFLAWIYL